MKDKRITSDMIALVPALADWGDAEISIVDWVGYVGNFQLAIGYSQIFWPKIVKFGEYVLVEQSAD